MKTISRLVILIFGLFCIVSFLPAKVSAQETAIKISPLTFKFNLEPGQSTDGLITVTNPADLELNITAEIEDFAAADEQGTPRFIPEGDQKMSLASWITVSNNEFDLAADQSKDIKFKVNVPSDGEPGGHYAAVFFKTQATKAGGKTQLGISGRVGALVLVSVPGNVEKTGEIVEFSAPKFLSRGPVKFKIRVKNTGTVHYESEGTIKINSDIASVPIERHIILPDSIREYEAVWPVKYKIGKFSATAEMLDGNGDKMTKSVQFIIFPWVETLIALAALIAITTTAIFLKKKFKIVSK